MRDDLLPRWRIGIDLRQWCIGLMWTVHAGFGRMAGIREAHVCLGPIWINVVIGQLARRRTVPAAATCDWETGHFARPDGTGTSGTFVCGRRATHRFRDFWLSERLLCDEHLRVAMSTFVQVQRTVTPLTKAARDA